MIQILNWNINRELKDMCAISQKQYENRKSSDMENWYICIFFLYVSTDETANVFENDVLWFTWTLLFLFKIAQTMKMKMTRNRQEEFHIPTSLQSPRSLEVAVLEKI